MITMCSRWYGEIIASERLSGSFKILGEGEKGQGGVGQVRTRETEWVERDRKGIWLTQGDTCGCRQAYRTGSAQVKNISWK